MKVESDLGEFGKEFSDWLRVPAVHVYNVSTGETTFLHMGWDVAVSADGAFVIISDFRGRVRVVDTHTKVSKPVTWPGRWGGIIGFTGPRTILYWGLPTTDAPQQWAPVGSPLVRRKHMLTIKLADLSTGEFQTIVGAIDPRHRVSYGPGK